MAGEASTSECKACLEVGYKSKESEDKAMKKLLSAQASQVLAGLRLTGEFCDAVIKVHTFQNRSYDNISSIFNILYSSSSS